MQLKIKEISFLLFKIKLEISSLDLLFVWNGHCLTIDCFEISWRYGIYCLSTQLRQVRRQEKNIETDCTKERMKKKYETD